MIIVKCLNLKTKEVFELEFWDVEKFKNFKRKAKYSEKIRILSIKDNTKYFD